MAHAVEACVHCGFCLPACPTYLELGDEMDSPRGRIFLMKEVLEGGLPLADATPHLDRCLGCQGCVTACPSGVPYGELITSFRGYAEERRGRPLAAKAYRAAIVKTLENPRRPSRGAFGPGDLGPDRELQRTPLREEGGEANVVNRIGWATAGPLASRVSSLVRSALSRRPEHHSRLAGWSSFQWVSSKSMCPSRIR